MADGAHPCNHWDVPVAPHRTNSVIGFAGGGGSSVGYKMATGLDPSMAGNHWLTAVLAHQRHFPATEHYCADVYEIDPLSWRPGEAIRFGWFSPDCTDHSKAKGSAPPPPPAFAAKALIVARPAVPPPVIERPPPPPPSRLRTLSAKAAQREILETLDLEPCTGPDLMEILKLREPDVRDALRALAEAGRVKGDAITAEGWRTQFWRLVGGEG